MDTDWAQLSRGLIRWESIRLILLGNQMLFAASARCRSILVYEINQIDNVENV